MESKGVVCTVQMDHEHRTGAVATVLWLSESKSEDNIMLVQWKTDADAALAEAKETKKPVLIDFSAAPA